MEFTRLHPKEGIIEQAHGKFGTNYNGSDQHAYPHILTRAIATRIHEEVEIDEASAFGPYLVSFPHTNIPVSLACKGRSTPPSAPKLCRFMREQVDIYILVKVQGMSQIVLGVRYHRRRSRLK